jgi:general secretion pathway protein N
MTPSAALRDPPGQVGWRMGLLAVLIYVASLIMSAPAAALAWAVAAATGRVATLEQARGGFWNGQATLVIADGPGIFHRFERLRWEWLPGRLIAGELALRVEIEDPRLHGGARLAAGNAGVKASDAAFHLAASALAGYARQLIPAGLTGDLSIRSEEFSFQNDGYRGAVTMEMRNAASALSSVRPFGEYRALVVGSGSHANFRVDTLGGALRIEGRGTWSRKDGLNFSGSARAVPAYKTELTYLLGFLGPDRAGEHPIAFSGWYRLAP